MQAGAAEPVLPGRRRSAPSGGSNVHEVTSVRGSPGAGPPQAGTTPSGGSNVHEVTSVGAIDHWPRMYLLTARLCSSRLLLK